MLVFRSAEGCGVAISGSNPETTNSFQEKITQKNGGSGSNSIKGSRSSGLQVGSRCSSLLICILGLMAAQSEGGGGGA